MLPVATVGSMTQTPDKEDRRIPTYSRGAWELKPHPIAAYDDFEGGYEELLKEAGFEQWTRINPDGASLILSVYRRYGAAPEDPDRSAQFLITVETPQAWEPVAAVDTADMMSVLAAWGPAVQASILGDLWHDCDYGQLTPLKHNRIANIAVIAAEGLDKREEWARDKHKRELEAKRVRQARAARQAKTTSETAL